jgi:hypothetical protein
LGVETQTYEVCGMNFFLDKMNAKIPKRQFSGRTQFENGILAKTTFHDGKGAEPHSDGGQNTNIYLAKTCAACVNICRTLYQSLLPSPKWKQMA